MEAENNPEIITTLLELLADPIAEKFNKMAIDYAKKNKAIQDAKAFRKIAGSELLLPLAPKCTIIRLTSP
jgi:hypothetical protein